MATKHFWLILFTLVVITSLGCGYVWVEATKQAELAYDNRQANSCLRLIYTNKHGISQKDQERIFLSLSQQQHLQPGQQALSLQNADTGLLLAVNGDRISLTSTQPLLEMATTDQEAITEIVAAFVGATLGDSQELGQQVAESLAAVENLQWTTDSKNLSLQFTCHN